MMDVKDYPALLLLAGVWIGLVAISVVSFIVGVHLLVSSIRRRHPY